MGNGDWSGDERRATEDMGWRENRLKVLGDLEELKEESRETKKEVTKMSVTLSVLQTKIGVMVAGISMLISTIVAFASSYIGAK